jgi:hypothetical protein
MVLIMIMSLNIMAVADGSPEEDCRCLCGSLLARQVPGGIELKCRRCHRVIVVALPDASRARHAGPRRRPAGE